MNYVKVLSYIPPLKVRDTTHLNTVYCILTHRHNAVGPDADKDTHLFINTEDIAGQ